MLQVSCERFRGVYMDVVKFFITLCIGFPRASTTKYHKLWLKRTEIYCLTILEAISPKSMVSAEPWYFWNLWRKSFLVSGGLPAIFGSWVYCWVFLFFFFFCLETAYLGYLMIFFLCTSLFSYAHCFLKVPCTLHSELSHVCLFATTWTIACQALCPWDFSDRNTGVGCHFLIQVIFPNRRLNPHLLYLQHCRWILYILSHQGSLVL